MSQVMRGGSCDASRTTSSRVLDLKPRAHGAFFDLGHGAGVFLQCIHYLAKQSEHRRRVRLRHGDVSCFLALLSFA